jgi:molybdate transport system ATP-binding protein
MMQSGRLTVAVQQTRPMRLSGGFGCEAGQMVALVGPSGAGKTSLLRVIAGLMMPTEAHIQIGDQVWCETTKRVNLPANRRRVGMVFQNYALMPHLSALHNVALACLDLPDADRIALSALWLGKMGLPTDLQLRRPDALSGGQQQRVALARALVRRPDVLLLDEPFSAVDQLTRQGLYALLAQVRQEFKIPIVLVTHDLHEARLLADRLVVMDSGDVLQEGSAAHLYRSPRNARVADLLGVQNRFFGRWQGASPGQGDSSPYALLQWLPSPDGPTQSDPLNPLILTVRNKGKKISPGQAVNWVIQGDGLHIEATKPEQRLVTSPECADKQREAAGSVVLDAHLQEIRYLGEISMAILQLHNPPGVTVKMTLSADQRRGLVQGQFVQVVLDCDWVHVMPVR